MVWLLATLKTKLKNMFTRFDTIHERDRHRTDRQMDRRRMTAQAARIISDSVIQVSLPACVVSEPVAFLAFINSCRRGFTAENLDFLVVILSARLLQRDLGIGSVSVCLSVRSSHVNNVKTNNRRIRLFTPPGSSGGTPFLRPNFVP